MSDGPYDPLDRTHLGESVANAMLSREPTRIDQIGAFHGAGIYAIYYTGRGRPYKLLGDVNRDDQFRVPIYVGKAVPKGSRKGLAVATHTNALKDRLREHRRSIEQATNLDAQFFWARWLVVENLWISLGESLLIGRFAPVWNSLVDGFGNHPPGTGGRGGGVLSRWDTLHPGRSNIARSGEDKGTSVLWSDRYPARVESADAIQKDVEEYLRQRVQV